MSGSNARGRVGATLLVYLQLTSTLWSCNPTPSTPNEASHSVEQALPGDPIAGYTRLASQSWIVGGQARASGRTPFETSVSDDGRARVSIPLLSPPGRGGLQPSLALEYDSSAGDGMVGVGWRLTGLSSISRCNANPANKGGYESQAGTEWCLDGIRLVPNGTTNQYVTLIDTEQLVERTSAGWTITAPDGSSREYNAGFPSASPMSWKLSEIRDVFGNDIRLTYDSADGLPVSMAYAGHRASNLAPSRSVAFQYEARLSPVSGFAYSSPMALNRRLNRVSFSAPSGVAAHSNAGPAPAPALVREYRLGYASLRASATPVDILSWVQECDGLGVCLEPISLTSSTADPGFGEEVVLAASTAGPIERYTTTDVDGDGDVDVLYRPSGAYPPWILRVIDKGVAGPEIDLGFSQAPADSPDPVSFDIDGDGLPELLGPAFAESRGSWNFFRAYRLSASQNPPSTPLPVSSAGGAEDRLTGRASFGDFDGDGTPDAFDVRHWETQAEVVNSLVFRRMNRSTGLFDPATTLPTRSCPQRASPDPVTGRTINCVNGGQCADCSSRGILDVPGLLPGTLPLNIYHAEAPRAPKGAVTSESRRSWVLEANVLVGDIDGNGRDDVLFRDALDPYLIGAPPAYAQPNFTTFHATRYSWWRGSGGSVSQLNIDQPATGPAESRSYFFLEYNGDGLPDLAFLTPTAQGHLLSIHVNRGEGNFAPTPITTQFQFTNISAFRFVDADLDGRTDLYEAPYGEVYYPYHQIKRQVVAPREGAIGVAFSDVNGDGLADLTYASGYRVYARLRETSVRGRVTLVAQGRRQEGFDYETAGPLTKVYTRRSTPCPDGQTCLKAGMALVRRHSVLLQDPLIEATARPVSTSYKYFDGRIDARGSGFLGFTKVVSRNNETGAVVEIVRKLDPADSVEAPGSARRFYPGVALPAQTTTCIDLRSGTAGSFVKTETFVSTTQVWSLVPGSTAEFTLSESERIVDSTSSEGSLAQAVQSPCTEDGVGSTAASALRSTRVRSTFDHDIEVSRVERNWLGGFSGVPRSIPTSPPGGVWESSTQNVLLAPSTTPWLRQRLERIVVSSTSPEAPPIGGHVVRTTHLTYAPSSAIVQSLTQERDHAIAETSTTSGFSLSVTFARDAYGNIERETTVASGETRERRAAFDVAERQFPVREWVDTTQVGVLLERFGVFDRAFGSAVAIDSVNGVRTRRQLDGFGRLRAESTPGHAATTVSYLVQGGQEVVTKLVGTSSSVARDVALLDAFGRPTQLEQNHVSDKPVFTSMKYDVFGRRSHTSYPYAVGRTPEYISTGFDRAGRIVSRLDSASGDQEAFSYVGLTARKLDARSNASSSTADARGRISTTTQYRRGGAGSDPFAGTQVSVSTRYAPFDLPAQVTDADGLSRTISYDVLGRRTGLVDPDSGPRQFLYNAFGEQKREIDGRGTVLDSQYDRLGRLSIKTMSTVGGAAPGRTGSLETYEYDTGSNGKGKLARTLSMDGVTTLHDYTVNGQPQVSTWVVPGKGTFSLVAAYDSEGRLSGITYPDATQVAYSYSANGAARGVYEVTPQGPSLLYAVTSRSASGLPLSEVFGNQVSTTRVIDRAERVRYERVEQPAQVSQPATVFRRTKYEYGVGGQLGARHELPTTDAPQAHTSEFYEYDDLARLKSWRVRTSSGSCSEYVTRYSYSNGGRLLARQVENHAGVAQPAWSTSLGYPAMTQPQPNAPRTLTEGTSVPSAFGYDGNGAMRDVFRNRAAGVAGTGDRQLHWTYFDLPRSIAEGGQTTTFSYDAFGRRVLKEMGTTWTLTLGGVFEDRSIGAGRRTTRTVTFEGRVVAVVQTEAYQTTRRYVHVDRLGSGATVTGGMGSNAQLFDRVKYDPFGERRNPLALAQPTQLPHALPSSGFTGHEQDDDVGLTNMKGRLYDARLGRFLSPDPMAMLTPQGLDRFAYVQNDPVNLVDPSGFEPITITAVAAAVGGFLHAVGSFFAAIAPYVLLAGAVAGAAYLIYHGVTLANAAYQAATGLGVGLANGATPGRLADAASPPSGPMDWADATGGRRGSGPGSINVAPPLQSEYDRLMRDSPSFRSAIDEVVARGGIVNFGVRTGTRGFAQTTWGERTNTVNIDIDTNNIDRANRGELISKSMKTPWAHQHTWGELMGHELGHGLDALRRFGFSAAEPTDVHDNYLDPERLSPHVPTWNSFRAIDLGRNVRSELNHSTGVPLNDAPSWADEVHRHPRALPGVNWPPPADGVPGHGTRF